LTVIAFAPGRVNLVGEHTDYNDGLALPFAIDLGVTVTAEGGGDRIEAVALDLDERDAFAAAEAAPAAGWRALVRGIVGELVATGCAVEPCRLTIAGTVPRGQGVASSAALEVALALALLRLHGCPQPSPIDLARLCSRAEQRWSGAETGLLDQLASLCGQPGRALRIDFRSLAIDAVPCALHGWQVALIDSGERRQLADTGYNARRAECTEALRFLGLPSLRDATDDDAARLPEPLRRRVLHLIGENRRVDHAAAALAAGDLQAVAKLLNASHASLCDLYEVSTEAVEETVRRALRCGAAGARIMGGGFGGQVLAMFPPRATVPHDALTVTPSAGAHLLG
jgi:galactokinase